MKRIEIAKSDNPKMTLQEIMKWCPRYFDLHDDCESEFGNKKCNYIECWEREEVEK